MYDKEKIYDEQISPLMTQIIDICQKNNINMIFSTFLREKTEDSDPLYCTTYLPSKEKCSDQLEDCYKVLFKGYEVQKPYIAAMTITKEATK